jgi:tetratricopeptide (TPR) repeat protein
MSAPRVRSAPLGVLALGLALGAAWLLFRSDDPGAPAEQVEPGPPAASAPPTLEPGVVLTAERAGFVDEAVCAACHAAEAEAWSRSHHALAMQPATLDTVLGDFADTTFEDESGRTRFFRVEPSGEEARWPDAGFRVETTGPDGRPGVFAVPYVFGVEPLQQVLLALPGGRLQALSVAWDTGARRWYSLYPDEHIGPRDPLHWSRGALNWNFSCAECHATDLVRGYDAEAVAYDTRWARLDVGCQACHGPAAGHLAAVDAKLEAPQHGFQAPIARDSRTEVEACARCHARRAPLADGFDHRHRLMDDYLPALLAEGLYFADGQIQDEVYEYGSFLQSKMHAKGVRCSDCHDPHAARPRREGNLLCTRCHSATPELPAHVDGSALVRKAYDATSHTGHAPGTPGSFCVDCHMPQRTYMGVDPRRDHGLRVPSPELAHEVGAPDACTSCHADQDAAWAAAWIAERSERPSKEVPFGRTLQAGRCGTPGAALALLELLESQAPPIVRATALGLLERYPGARANLRFAASLEDPDPLVRHAALGWLETLPPTQRALGRARLSDPVRAVRIEAARVLLDTRDVPLGPERDAAEAEFEAAQRALLDRPEARLNLARLLSARDKAAGAEHELRAALRIDPAYVPAAVNLAELVRERSEPEAEALLREALDAAPRSAPLEHTLGLALVRQGRREEALEWLTRAATHAPEEPRFGYVLAIALDDAGRRAEALAELERVRAESPWFRDAHLALASYQQAGGDVAAATRTLAELAAINPDDPALAGGGR